MTESTDCVEVYHATGFQNVPGILEEGLLSHEHSLTDATVDRVKASGTEIAALLSRLIGSGFAFAQPSGDLLNYNIEYGYMSTVTGHNPTQEDGRLDLIALQVNPRNVLAWPLGWLSAINNCDNLDKELAQAITLESLLSSYERLILPRGDSAAHPVVWKLVDRNIDDGFPAIVANPELLIPVDRCAASHFACGVVRRTWNFGSANYPTFDVPIDLFR